MNEINRFKSQYGLGDDIILAPYGSRVYGTQRSTSDYDYIAIIPPNDRVDTGTEYHHNNVDIHIYNREDFQHQLNLHKIHTLEVYFLPDNLCQEFDFQLSLPMLRRSISQKASHSFVKAKKKLEVEKDYYIGWKSLFHSLRILEFGIQIASEGKITDYSKANHFWLDILHAQHYNWEFFKESYQPVYNRLATEFRKLAPKQ